MNHKLRVLVRVDVDPGHVTLEISGCVTPSDSAALLHIVRRACRLGAGVEVVIDLHGASHLDPEILLELRRLVAAGPVPAVGETGTGEPGTGESAPAVPLRLTLDEPADLPICLLHVGAEAEVLAGLETGFPAAPLGDGGTGGALLDLGPDAGLADANSPLPAETGSVNDLDLVNGLALSEYFEGTLDPGATVKALSDTALCQLADALYRHLDTSNPSFGAHTWYELAAEELQYRHLTEETGPDEDQIAPDTALA
ncbi:hypothetical protein [Arthrobacter sp. PM3]|uniref:hypothetical protein n=1 Tax=Arthrobacter sp. PM3 TaxID=2017685 RepID=UPI000E1061A2|nr:hypothetical protein [Arthrobacter sp. PM3]AXJ09614.1 hypothetical protein CFN17_08290 [Arthrobacter sp. PM3]